MTRPSEDFDDPIRTIGADATATFDEGASNPTEHASSEALASATDNKGEGDPVSAPDDAVEPILPDGDAGSDLDESDLDEDDDEDDLEPRDLAGS